MNTGFQRRRDPKFVLDSGVSHDTLTLFPTETKNTFQT